MTQPTAIRGGLELSGVQKLHKQGHGAADLSLAFFPFADRAQVVDAQNASKAGLSEPGPLSDRLEGGWGHFNASVNAAMIRCLWSYSTCCHVRIFAAGREDSRSASQNRAAMAAGSATSLPKHQKGTALRCIAGGVEAHRNAGNHAAIVQHGSGKGALGVPADFRRVSHFHSPVSGGARPRVDVTIIGPLGRYHKHNRTRFVAFFNSAIRGGEE